MRRSRIAVVMIDHPKESFDASADFWADPGGLAFCVVPVWTDPADFERHSTSWD